MENDQLPMRAPSTAFNLVVKGRSQTVLCYTNKTLLQALIDGGILLEANCGGRGTCGKCKLQVLHGKIVDSRGGTAIPQQNNIHLACQVYPCEDVTIRIETAEASAKGNVTANFESNDQPLLKKIVITPKYPTFENHYSLQEMISATLEIDTPILWDTKIIQQLAEVMLRKAELITVVLIDNGIIAIESGDTTKSLFGVAFDIGTTTVVGMLVDVNNKKIIATHSKTNPQAAFGADVISRIGAAATHGGLEAEASAIRLCLNQIIEELCISMKILSNQIYVATIAGNSTMEHLLMAISPLSLASKPYASVFKQIAPFSPDTIGLNINPYGKIVLLPNVTSFIGGDTTAAIIATDQDVSPRQSLLVDLGTNGEMVLGNREKLFACSTAAGPAFEGSHIRDGMRAFPGAIEDVVIEDDVYVRIIGDGKAAGICGSGIVKGVSELVKKKIITASGRFDKNIGESLPVSLSTRLKNKGEKWEFVLVRGQDSTTGLDISITQADVRQIQLVKSAICTGVQILMEKFDPEGELSIFLAGAFGNYIDIESALAIGLLPTFKKEQIQSVGNAAGVGAVHALLSKDKLDRCYSIAGKIHYVELANQPQFQSEFLANLAFSRVPR